LVEQGTFNPKVVGSIPTRPIAAIRRRFQLLRPDTSAYGSQRRPPRLRQKAPGQERDERHLIATGEVAMPRRVLIVSTVEHGDDELHAHVGEADEVKVVVPVVRQGVLDWLANDEKAFGHAERVAERTADQLPGETVETVAGEANVGLAIRDALATFPADEIVVAVRPRDEEGLVESVATDNAPRREVEGVPVRFVVIPG
jgi:hypothetical protein